MSGRVDAAVAASPTRCSAHTRMYRGGVLVEQGFDVARVSDHLDDPTAVVWLDLLQPDEADLAVLVEELGLHPLAVEDALHAHQRPKLDRYADHDFLAAYSATRRDGELVAVEMAAFVTPRALVTVRKDPGVDLAPVLVDAFTEAAQDLDDEGDALEGDLFGDVSQDDLQRRTFALRSSVAELRRLVVPMREVVTTLHRRDSRLADPRTEPYFRDVEDHLLRVQATLDELRELLATVLDTTIALQGQRLNETIFKLTAWAAILAVTTAITGFFGQNIPYPGIEQRSGFLTSTVLLVGSVAALFVYFKRKGWL